MNRIPFRFTVLLACCIPSLLRAQVPDFSNASATVVAEWLVPRDEFGRFWKPGPGAGLTVETPIRGPLFFLVGGRLARFERSESPRKEKIPDIVLLTLTLGLRAEQAVSPLVRLFADCSLANNSFVFTGRAAPRDFDNKVESEFGLQATLGMRIGRIGISVSYQHIFTGLEPVGVASGGFSYSPGRP